jgi:HEAT repeat protein
VNAYVRQLVGFMDRAEIRRAHLVGHSMGGQIALAFAATFRWIYRMTEEDYSPATWAFVEWVLMQVHANPALVTSEQVEAHARQWRTAEGRGAIKAALTDLRLVQPALLYRLKASSWAGRTRLPVEHRGLVVWGAKDPWFPSAGLAELSQDLPGAQTLLVEKAGHLPHVERPDLVAAALVKAFRDPAARIRIEPAGFDTLLASTRGGDPVVAGYAALALAGTGDPRALETLLELLRGAKDPFARAHTAEAMAALGDRAIDAVTPWLASQDPRAHQQAIDTLARGGTRRAAQALAGGLGTRRGFYALKRALGSMGPVAVEPLLAAALGQDSGARERAREVIDGLAFWRPLGPQATGLLTAALQRPDSAVWAARLLGKQGDKRAVEPLLEALRADDAGLRRAAVGALGTLGDPRALEPLVAMLRSPQKALYDRSAVATALGRLGDRRAVEPLLRALADSSPFVRWNAAKALGALGDPRALQPLLELLEPRHRGSWESAVQGVGRLGDPRAIPALIRVLGDTKKDVNVNARQNTAIALARLTGKWFGEDAGRWQAWWSQERGSADVR